MEREKYYKQHQLGNLSLWETAITQEGLFIPGKWQGANSLKFLGQCLGSNSAFVNWSFWLGIAAVEV